MFSQLRYAADRRTLGFVAAYLSLVLVGWLIWDDLNTPVKILWVGTTSLFSFFCAVITHNMIHAPVFKKKRWNRAFQYLISVCYGHPVSAFVPGHNLSHHLHTQSPRDVMRTTKARFKVLATCWRAYVRPGKRVMHDGSDYIMPPRFQDQEWIPGVGDTPAGVSLGAES